MSQKTKVLIANRFDHGTLLQIQNDPDIEFIYGKKIHDLSEHFNEAQGLIVRSSTKIDKDLLSSIPNLKFVITATSGFDHFDLDEMAARKVEAFHIPETQSVAAAEMTILMMMAACRKFSLARKQLEKGIWERQILLGRQLTGQNLGVVGLGE
ncbi:MAG: hypothetical protein HRT44_05530 [Bdellovibrionales bacterium]|nr:hypothetical protein [Bdellovibrionales bacterium]NQZ18704.1 hypothetical protein [Bdellovibrionales bacterium]